MASPGHPNLPSTAMPSLLLPRDRNSGSRGGMRPILNAPTQQFLASVVVADIPIPSIEEPRVLEEELADTMSPISQLSDMDDIPLTPDGGPDRKVSPPKTPAPGFLPSLSPKQYPNWSVDSTLSSLESSPDYESSRPSTAHSTHTSTSLLSYFSIYSEELSQPVSPETEHVDHFSELSSAEDNDKTIKAATREVSREQLRRVPWTKPMIRHLWSTYMMYLQDPKVTPLRLGKSGIPASGESACELLGRQRGAGKEPRLRPMPTKIAAAFLLPPGDLMAHMFNGHILARPLGLSFGSSAR
ncbi:hypothetical protein MRS44_017546 [Fusarium solani]|uniref:uncharacterized protein n=1 Tax=Fusarium solani TaxID=169388 RepID=UPI0032C428E9|nr:hypothetical protein MRS44_017546 [Fusarium solani]